MITMYPEAKMATIFRTGRTGESWCGPAPTAKINVIVRDDRIVANGRVHGDMHSLFAGDDLTAAFGRHPSDQTTHYLTPPDDGFVPGFYQNTVVWAKKLPLRFRSQDLIHVFMDRPPETFDSIVTESGERVWHRGSPIANKRVWLELKPDLERLGYSCKRDDHFRCNRCSKWDNCSYQAGVMWLCEPCFIGTGKKKPRQRRIKA